MITKENEQIALDCLKSVLALIHERHYKELVQHCLNISD